MAKEIREQKEWISKYHELEESHDALKNVCLWTGQPNTTLLEVEVSYHAKEQAKSNARAAIDAANVVKAEEEISEACRV